jgi:hypothetical protein
MTQGFMRSLWNEFVRFFGLDACPASSLSDSAAHRVERVRGAAGEAPRDRPMASEPKCKP